MSETASALLVTTSIVAFISGFGLGIYSIRGWLFLSPDLAAERAAVYNDPVESEESDIDEEETLLDHAPNWANGADADRRQGLRATAAATAASSSSGVRYDGSEECKLVLVVRTDLGMTKGSFRSAPFLLSYPAPSPSPYPLHPRPVPSKN
jgi:PTH2 family peptidyl-tRNA hydrolase